MPAPANLPEEDRERLQNLVRMIERTSAEGEPSSQRDWALTRIKIVYKAARKNKCWPALYDALISRELMSQCCTGQNEKLPGSHGRINAFLLKLFRFPHLKHQDLIKSTVNCRYQYNTERPNVIVCFNPYHYQQVFIPHVNVAPVFVNRVGSYGVPPVRTANYIADQELHSRALFERDLYAETPNITIVGDESKDVYERYRSGGELYSEQDNLNPKQLSVTEYASGAVYPSCSGYGSHLAIHQRFAEVQMQMHQQQQQQQQPPLSMQWANNPLMYPDPMLNLTNLPGSLQQFNCHQPLVPTQVQPYPQQQTTPVPEVEPYQAPSNASMASSTDEPEIVIDINKGQMHTYSKHEAEEFIRHPAHRNVEEEDEDAPTPRASQMKMEPEEGERTPMAQEAKMEESPPPSNDVHMEEINTPNSIESGQFFSSPPSQQQQQQQQPQQQQQQQVPSVQAKLQNQEEVVTEETLMRALARGATDKEIYRILRQLGKEVSMSESRTEDMEEEEQQPKPTYSDGRPVTPIEPRPLFRSNPSELVDLVRNHSTFECVEYVEREKWLALQYFEESRQIGDVREFSNSFCLIDGFTSATNSSTRFSIGYLTNVHRSSRVSDVRSLIGKGIRLYLLAGEVYLENLGSMPVFVQSISANMKIGFDLGAIIKVPQTSTIKVFDMRQFSKQLAAAAEKTYNDVMALTRMCTIRFAFLRGWGAKYRRTPLTRAPVWFHAHFLNPLAWADNVLTCMGAPPRIGDGEMSCENSMEMSAES